MKRTIFALLFAVAVAGVAQGFPGPFSFLKQSPANSHMLFVTSTMMLGSSLGGLSGADTICAARAAAGALGSGPWRALLSVNGLNAKDKIFIGGPVYNLRPAGSGGPQVVATSSADLWDGAWANSAHYDETGAAKAVGSAWTGTNANGTYATNTCTDWTAASTAAVGTYTTPTAAILSSGSSSCSSSFRVYCISGQVQPNSPSQLAAQPRTGAKILLTWKDNAGDETGFEIQRSLDGSTGWTLVQSLPADSTSWTDSSLTSGTTYYYRIRAVNVLGQSSYSLNASSPAYDTVHALFATSTTSTASSIGGLAGADAACAARASAAGLVETNWRSLLGISGVNPKDRTVLLGPVYNLRPAASGGRQLLASNSTDMWDGAWGASVLYDENGTNLTSGSVWSGSNADGTAATNSCTNWFAAAPSAATGNLASTTQHVYQSGSSACSNSLRHYCISGQPQPNPPSQALAEPRHGSTMILSWNDNADDESGFEIERSLTGTSGWSLVQLLAANSRSWTDSGLTAGTTYYYRIRAVNGNGSSSYTPNTSATAIAVAHVLFATSSTYQGSTLGGIGNADATCGSLASAAGLTETNWKAFLSGATMNLKDRVTIGGAVYNLRPAASGGRQIIATSSTDLWDGSWAVGVNYDQSSTLLTSGSVWTGTNANGTYSNTCTGWVANTTAAVGNYTSTTTGLFTTNSAACSVSFRFYCISGQ